MADLLLFPPLPQEPEVHQHAAALLGDAAARARALDIRASWIVEAPAGSGKTGLLIQRFLKLLAFGGVHRPDQVLALTFTRKADAEMRNRVVEQLAAAAQDLPLPPGARDFERQTREFALAVLARDREHNWRILDSPNQLNIRTIDSFCAELAGSMPLLSAGRGRLSPAEDARPLYRRAAERTLRELGGKDHALSSAIETVLLHRDASVPDFVHLLAEMLAQREQWGELIPLSLEHLNDAALEQGIRRKLDATLRKVICHALNRASLALGAPLLSELAAFANRVSVLPAYKAASSPVALCSQFAQSPGSTAEDLPHWLALVSLLLAKDGSWRRSFAPNHLLVTLPRSDQDWLRDFISELRAREELRPDLRSSLADLRCLPPTSYPEAQWQVVKALCRVLRHALLELQLLFRAGGKCDFAEIALTATSLLEPGSATDPVQTPGARLAHLLVDEMQDTSASQYRLLESLTSTWDGSTQTIFLVGDPKQSIYAFRQARVERFLNVMALGRLGDVPVAPLRLTANFRSQAELVRSFNHAFSHIFPTPEEITGETLEVVDVPFVAADPVNAPRQRGPSLRWHLSAQPYAPASLEPDEADMPPPTVAEDAAEIRKVIERFLSGWRRRSLEGGEKPRPPRVAVLGRNRSHLAPVIAEFHKKRGAGPLPFRAVDVENLNQRPEVLDLLALTRALLHPADRIAWFAVLRSPVCGLTLGDLLALSGEGVDSEQGATVAHLVQTRHGQLSFAGQGLLQRAWPILREAQDSLGRTSFSTQVERTWRSLGGDASLRPEERTNAQRFLDLLADLEDGTEPLTIPLLDRRLQALYAEPFAGETAVELMTIHKSKGLEWDLVVVPGLERSSGRNAHELLKWMELDFGAETGFILAPIQSKGDEATALSKWLSRLQANREAAEAKRLFYVACTRAREELHLFAAPKRKKDGTLSTPASTSLLKAAWAYAEPILNRLANPAIPAPLLFPPIAAPEASLSLAAAAEADLGDEDPASGYAPIRRLPVDYVPLHRFRSGGASQLPYPPATALRQALPFTRPEGSYAARAFGNAVHRLLQLASERLAAGTDLTTFLQELQGWEPRITTVLRAEGLAAPVASREATRVRQALETTLHDPIGSWLLSPLAGARSESTLVSSDAVHAPVLRADRTFFAGERPLASADESYLWIVDFKTSEPGGRDLESFLADQRTKYTPQMNAYATASRSAGQNSGKIVLGLYFPLLGRLVYWLADTP